MQHLPAFGRDERQLELLSSRAQGLDHSGRPGLGGGWARVLNVSGH